MKTNKTNQTNPFLSNIDSGWMKRLTGSRGFILWAPASITGVIPISFKICTEHRYEIRCPVGVLPSTQSDRLSPPVLRSDSASLLPPAALHHTLQPVFVQFNALGFFHNRTKYLKGLKAVYTLLYIFLIWGNHTDVIICLRT